MHWSLTSLPSRQPKPIDLALGMRKQSWIGGLMRRIKTLQNTLTCFCCIRIIIRQFLHISNTLVPKHCQSLPVTSLSKLGATTTGLPLQAPVEVVQWTKSRRHQQQAPRSKVPPKCLSIPENLTAQFATIATRTLHALMITKVFKCFQIHAI